jgi:hypothetical protein
MPNIITTARGERVDLDVIKIKGQLAQAPMNVEVERRKQFIDTKEEKAKRVVPELVATPEALAALEAIKQESKVEPEAGPETFEPVAAPSKKK